MYSDIGNWVNFLNNELDDSGQEKMDKAKICKDLKLTSISVLKDHVKNLKGRQLTRRLIELKYGFEIAAHQIKNGVELGNNEKLPFLAICHSLLLLIGRTEKDVMNLGKDFNTNKYFTKLEKDLNNAENSKDIMKIIGQDECILKKDDNNVSNNLDVEKDISSSLVDTIKKLYGSKKKLKESNDEDTEYEDDSDEEEDDEEDEYEEDEEDEDEEDEEEDEDEDEYEEEQEEDDDDDKIMTRSQTRKRGGWFLVMNRQPNKKKKVENKVDSSFLETIGSMIENNGSKALRDPDEREAFEDKLLKYFTKCEPNLKDDLLEKFKTVLSCESNIEPLLFKIVNLNIPNETKNDIVNEYLNMEGSYSDKAKLKTWLENVIKIPFGKEVGKNLSELKDPVEISNFVGDMNRLMDEAVYGHEEAKRNIVQVMVQYITNPESKGSCIGIWGPPGNGKTTLIKEGIAKAMEREFVFISLGGAQDSSYLDGHSFTYEGSIYGRIAQGLMKCKCMNPIIYFDELDKVSESYKGMEIVNLLVHLIDPAQNSEFVDKYFYNLKLDLSKVTFMFSYNNPSLIDPILKDRITQVQTKFLILDQKIHISKNYLLPAILKDVGIKENSIDIKNDLLEYIISSYTNEGGVRKIKKILYSLVRQLNILNLTKEKLCGKTVKWPFKIKKDYLQDLLTEFDKVEFQKIHNESKVGVINGMWAGSLGLGGVLPIESSWVPSKERNFIEATGSLEKVIKESVKVANTLALSMLSEEKKKELDDKFEKDPYGIHVHCPDGATPKDGPSAGTALTVLLYSLYCNKKIRNDIAITGEINLQGEVLEIGGLEEKLGGAKKAGVKTALIPKSNLKDITKISKRNPDLIGKDFKVLSVSNIEEVLDIVLCE
jgi:endopeptidase La